MLKLLFLANAALVSLLCLAPQANAQIRAITFTLDSGDDYTLEEHAAGSQNLESVVRIQGTVVQDFLGTGSKDEVPLTPQKRPLLGELTYTGEDSDYSPWEGTMTAVADLTNGKLQLLGGELVAKMTGAYCPGVSPTEGNNECPIEADGQYGFSLSVGAGSVEATTRDLLTTLNGPSNIVGTEIDTLNWHFFVLRSNSAYDDDGAIEGQFGPDTLVVPEPGQEPPVGHNENDPGAGLSTVNESTFYKGTFTQDGTDASILIPINGTYFIRLNNSTDENGDGIPDDHVRILFTGELKGDGPLGATLTPGDFNQDGEVNGLDVNILSLHHGTGEDHTHTPDQLDPPVKDGVPHPHYALWNTGDANFDGIANDADLAVVAANFAPGGAGAGAGTHAVPEPSGLLLASAALALLAISRPHRAGHPQGLGRANDSAPKIPEPNALASGQRHIKPAASAVGSHNQALLPRKSTGFHHSGCRAAA